MNLFFFYGSLRTGYWNQRILSRKAIKVGDAQTVQPFELYIGRFGTVPTCVPTPAASPLKGELYQLDEQDAKRVFQLEVGYDHAEFDVITSDGQIHKAMIFHHSNPEDCAYLGRGFILVPSGDYTKAVKPNGERV